MEKYIDLVPFCFVRDGERAKHWMTVGNLHDFIDECNETLVSLESRLHEYQGRLTNKDYRHDIVDIPVNLLMDAIHCIKMNGILLEKVKVLE